MNATDVTGLEDLIISTSRQLGVHPNANAMTQVALDLAGSTVIDGMIVIVDKGSLRPRTYVESLRASMPSGFAPIDTPTLPLGNLTDQWRREIAENISKALPAEWDNVRSRMKGLTARMMDERASGESQ